MAREERELTDEQWAWLAQLAGGRHGMQYQYPRQLATIMRAFFAAPGGAPA